MAGDSAFRPGRRSFQWDIGTPEEGATTDGLVKRSAQRFAAAVGIVLVLFAVVVRLARPAREAGDASLGAGTPAPHASATPTPPPGKGRPAIVFFAHAGGEGLVARKTEVVPFADPSLQAKAILDAMLAGPEALPAAQAGETREPALPVLPKGVVVRAVFFDGKGTAIVDLGGLAERLTGGSDAEVLALWSVANALAFNFPVDARRVKVLLDGREEESAGHVSLVAPLSPRRDLITGEVPSLAVPMAGTPAELPDIGVPEDEEDAAPSPFDDLPPEP